MTSLRYHLRFIFLNLSKLMGLFYVSRQITKKGLRILCYHNFGDSDEVAWHPKLFITPDTFLNRMQYLNDKGYTIIDLETALNNLLQNTGTNFPVVITIDDGWHGVMKFAHPVLRAKKFPYTIYVTSYYSLNAGPVFNLAIAYMFDKTSKQIIDLSPLKINEIKEVDISDTQKKAQAVNWVIAFGDKENFDTKQQILQKTAHILGIDVTADIIKRKIFHIMQRKALQNLSNQGVQLQLHTHRHRWPKNEISALDELTLNRDYLRSIQQNECDHFCYPSGFYTQEQFSILKKANIRSATTCEPGLNFPSTNPYALKRFLDGENISQIEFEAELSGYLFLLRQIKNIVVNFKNTISND